MRKLPYFVESWAIPAEMRIRALTILKTGEFHSFYLNFYITASCLRGKPKDISFLGFPMIIRLLVAFCAATFLSACGQVDYGLKHTNHKIIKDRVICRGDKYPTGFHAGHVDRATLEVLKIKCDLQKGRGSFPIEIVISHDPNIQPFEYRDAYNDETGAPEHRIYGVFCPTTWDYKVKVEGHAIGGNSRTIGECKYKYLGSREISGNEHNGKPVNPF